MVPAVTRASRDFDTGVGSPVTIDSSTRPPPSVRRPSTGIFSPGFTRSRSPTATRSSDTLSSCPSAVTRVAVFGARSSSARIAPDVFSRARSSRTWPNSTSTVMTAAASKYTGTAPSAMRSAAGNHAGSTVATTL